MKLTAHQAMSLAIEEGHRGAGFVSPNPLVGCVILDSKFELISKGYHQKFGEAHAEINALNDITDKTKLIGAHVFVTLEPCAHEGKTGSCAKALAKLPIASVTYGLKDPYPEVAGRGVEILRSAGLKVSEFNGENEILKVPLQELCEIFLHNIKSHMPFVALKIGSSLDGQIAMASGESQWITGEASRAQVQFLRGKYDAILIGATTFLKDNPRLKSRDPHFENRRSKAIILDPESKVLPQLETSELGKVYSKSEIILVVRQKSTSSPYPTIQAPLNGHGHFDLQVVLKELKKIGVHSLLVEGGAFTFSAFLQQKLAERIYLFMAPMILGKGLGWSSHLSLEKLSDQVTLENTRIEKFGNDFLVTGRTCT